MSIDTKICEDLTMCGSAPVTLSYQTDVRSEKTTEPCATLWDMGFMIFTTIYYIRLQKEINLILVSLFSLLPHFLYVEIQKTL